MISDGLNDLTAPIEKPRLNVGDEGGDIQTGPLTEPITDWNFILKGAKNTRAAEALLFYMQKPEMQADLVKASGYAGGSKAVAQLVGPALEESLATSPSHVATASVVDAEWWAENNSAVQARWNAWMAKQ